MEIFIKDENGDLTRIANVPNDALRFAAEKRCEYHLVFELDILTNNDVYSEIYSNIQAPYNSTSEEQKYFFATLNDIGDYEDEHGAGSALSLQPFMREK